MTSLQRAKIAAGISYAALALVTFGREAAHSQKWQDAHCATLDMRVFSGGDCYSSPVIAGFGAGALWPFYWSWEAWS